MQIEDAKDLVEKIKKQDKIIRSQGVEVLELLLQVHDLKVITEQKDWVEKSLEDVLLENAELKEHVCQLCLGNANLKKERKRLQEHVLHLMNMRDWLDARQQGLKLRLKKLRKKYNDLKHNKKISV